jgi:DNA repair protein SbcD/Mre11
MKFIFATDFHIMGSSPNSRVDDYPRAILKKIEEVFSIAEDENVDFLLLGGDLFETYNVSTSVIRKTLEWFKDRNIPIISILGNHDLHGHTMDTFYRSAMSILDITDFVDILDVDEKRSLRGLHYYNGLEKDLDINNEPSEKMQEILNGNEMIWVVHGMISDMNLPHVSRNVLINDVRVGENTKLVLSGDYHAGFPVVERNDGVIFANPGSLSRTSLAKENLDRSIQVALIEYDPEDLDAFIDIKYIELKSALSSDKIFDLAAHKEIKERREETFSYIEKLKDLEVEGGIRNIEEELRVYAQNVKLEDEVLNEIFNRLQERKSEREVKGE